MLVILYILVNNILPVFILIFLGFILGKKFDLSLFTLSKLSFYLFGPAFTFYYLYSAELSFKLIKILYFCIVYMAVNYILALVISKIRKFDAGMKCTFLNTIMFNNTGNIGISLITLVFGNAPFVINGQTPYLREALAAQVIILVFNNATMNTIGFYNAGRASMSVKNAIAKIFGIPIIYVIILAFFFNYINADITWLPVWPALLLAKDGLVPISLVTLGVQLSKNKFYLKDINVHIAVLVRLIAGPALALAGIHLFGFTGVLAHTMLISCSTPTAVTVALIAAEYDNNQGFASQEVIWSTVASAFTLTLCIYIAGILFPV